MNYNKPNKPNKPNVSASADLERFKPALYTQAQVGCPSITPAHFSACAAHQTHTHQHPTHPLAKPAATCTCTPPLVARWS